MDTPFRKQVRRYNIPGDVHFLTFSCVHRQPFLKNERFCNWLIISIINACKYLNYELWAYVIMPEHVHLVVNPKNDKYDIAKFLQAVKQPVSRKVKMWLRQNNPLWMDKLSIDRGCGKFEFRFWQAGGGYDLNINTEDYAIKTIEYIHNNPVRRGLVDDPLIWKWSSATWWKNVGTFGVDLVELENSTAMS